MADESIGNLAVARVYSQALMNLATARDEVDRILLELKELAGHAERNADFRAFLADPSLDTDARRASIDTLFRGRLSDILVDTMQVLNRKGRLPLFLEVGDGIARVYGLKNVMAGELLEFPNQVMGLALNLEESSVGAVLLGDFKKLREGDTVKRTGKVMSIPVGREMVGRVVNPLGQPLDDKGPIHTSHSRPLEMIAPGIAGRQPVTEPLQTGIKAVDAMIPIGRGQRELIIGDRQTGKTAVAIDTIINQKGSDVICVYVAIGQKESTVVNLVDRLREVGRHGLLDRRHGRRLRPGPAAVHRALRRHGAGRVLRLRGGQGDPLRLRRPEQAGRGLPRAVAPAAPPAGPRGVPRRRLLPPLPPPRAQSCKLKDLWIVTRKDAPQGRAQGHRRGDLRARDGKSVAENSIKAFNPEKFEVRATTPRTASTPTSTARTCGPSSRRSTRSRSSRPVPRGQGQGAVRGKKDKDQYEVRKLMPSGGSLTALPIIETQEGEVSAYIPTNVISITDGQIYLEPNLFFAGVRPAINVGISVSRVGGNAQTQGHEVGRQVAQARPGLLLGPRGLRPARHRAGRGRRRDRGARASCSSAASASSSSSSRPPSRRAC
jgi:F-type H+-transporting ATPase subunit alpha